MIDRAARDQARDLVLRLRDGSISNDQFVDAWPRNRADAALQAIATMLWGSYDDRREYRLTGENALSPPERDLMTRCALFLESDLAYAWKQRDFMRVAGIGPLTYLSLGLLWPLDWWIKRSNRRFEADLAASGDFQSVLRFDGVTKNRKDASKQGARAKCGSEKPRFALGLAFHPAGRVRAPAAALRTPVRATLRRSGLKPSMEKEKQMRVYLAGPEVFLPNARAVLDAKIALTRRYGFTPVSPGDLEIEEQPSKRAFGLAISAVNEKLMLSAEMIIANLTPFRGIAADVGTVYELGFMCARGCPAFAFSNVAKSHFERLQLYYQGGIATDAQGRARGPDGLAVEDFDMVENLMLDGGIEARGGAFVTRAVAPGELFEDLTAFEETLRIAAGRLLPAASS